MSLVRVLLVDQSPTMRAALLGAQLEGHPLRLLHHKHHQPRVGILAFFWLDLQLSAEQLKSVGITELPIKGVYI
ncbi:hypothetical protein [Amycolatopsis sp. lyj-23]|uniref:hypothetical protein n=1 Tax=Amycolatopsis sp. lyj-23 TaxID=2789283 RepID=UPI00397BE3B6